MRRGRSTSGLARVLGVVLLIPGLLQVPLPRVEFHIVRHQHGPGQVCPKHDHLLRWHPHAGEGEGVAVLHWHWMLPRSVDSAEQYGAGRSIPALHAHDGDQEWLDSSAGPVFVANDSGRELQGAIAAPPGLAGALAPWLAPPPPSPPDSGAAIAGIWAGAPPDAARARLVRWNC